MGLDGDSSKTLKSGPHKRQKHEHKHKRRYKVSISVSTSIRSFCISEDGLSMSISIS